MMAHRTFADLDDFVDEAVKVKTLFHHGKVKDKTMEAHLLLLRLVF